MLGHGGNPGKFKSYRRLEVGFHNTFLVQCEDLDRAVYAYLEENTLEGLSLSNKELKKQAKEIAGGLHVQNFKVSSQ